MQEICQWGVVREVKRGDLEPLFLSPIVLIGEAYGRAAQSGNKY